MVKNNKGLIIIGVVLVAAFFLLGGMNLFKGNSSQSAYSLDYGVTETKASNVYASGTSILGDFYLNVQPSVSNALSQFVVEMQVVPKGTQPQSVVSMQGMCAPDNKMAVYKTVSVLVTGGPATVSLKVDNVPNGQWDVYVITVSKCYAAGDGDRDMAPYGYGVKKATITISGSSVTTLSTTPTTLPNICVGSEEIFYSNGMIKSGNNIFWLFNTQYSGKIVRPSDADSAIPGFSLMYHTNKDTACCKGSKPSLMSQETAETNTRFLDILGSLFPGAYDSSTKITYSQYKCVEGENTGFCFDAAQSWLGSTTGADCQTNTMLLVGLVLLGAFLLISATSKRR